jgi:hypothetical protein
MISNEIIQSVIDKGIEDFSQNYIEKLENKDTYTVEDIKSAFVEGAKWMQGFLDVTTIMQKQL